MNRKLYFTKQNYLLFLVAIIMLILGYFLMSVGPHDSFLSLTVSPVILLIAYIIVLPMAIMKNFKKNKKNVDNE